MERLPKSKIEPSIPVFHHDMDTRSPTSKLFRSIRFPILTTVMVVGLTFFTKAEMETVRRYQKRYELDPLMSKLVPFGFWLGEKYYQYLDLIPVYERESLE